MVQTLPESFGIVHAQPRLPQCLLSLPLHVVDAPDVRLSEGRGQNNQQPTPNDNNKRVVVFLCGSGS